MPEMEKLTVKLEAQVKGYQSDLNKASRATQDWADDTERAGTQAQVAAKKSESAFSRITRAIKDTRKESKKDASFRVNAEERGFSGILSRIQNVRKETADDATMNVRFTSEGSPEVLSEAGAVGTAMDRLDGRDINMRLDFDSGGAVGKMAATQGAMVGMTGASEGFIDSIKSAGSTLRATGLIGQVGLIGIGLVAAAAGASPAAAGIGAVGVAGASAGAGVGLLAGVTATLTRDLGRANKVTGGYGRTLRELKSDALGVRDSFFQTFRPASREAGEFGIELGKVSNNWLPELGREAKENVGAVRSAFRGASRELGGGEKDSFLAILDSSSDTLGSLGRSAGRFGGALVNAGAEAIPVVRDLEGWISDISKAALTFTRENPDAIRDWFKNAVPLASELAEFTGKVIRLIGSFSNEHSDKLVAAVGKINDALGTVEDIFDLKAPKPVGWEHAGKTAGVSFVAKYNEKLRQNANSQGDEGSPARELGLKTGNVIVTAIDRVMKNKKVAGPSIKLYGGEEEGPGVVEQFASGVQKKLNEYFEAHPLQTKNIKDWLQDPFGKAWDLIPWNKIITWGNFKKAASNVPTIKVGADVFGGLVERAKDAAGGVKNQWNKLDEDSKNKWKAILENAKPSWLKIGEAIIAGSQKGKEGAGSRNRDLETNTDNIWQRILENSGIWGRIASAIISNSVKGKEKGSQAQRELETNDKNIWQRILENSGVWGKVASAIISNSQKSKERGGESQRELESNTKGIWGRIKSNAGIWGDIASIVGEKAWDAARMAENAFTSIIDFINRVLKAVDLPTISLGGGSGSGAPASNTQPGGGGTAGPVLGARGGMYHASGRTEGLIPMASGGIIAQAATGGIADGNTPRAVYGEVGKAESYTVHGRRDNLPYAEKYLRSVGYTAQPREHRHDPEALAYMARGGILKAWRQAGTQFNAKGRIDNTGAGTGPYGPTANHLWDAATRERAERIIAEYPVSVNTYENHPPGYPGYAQSSIDAWALAGRGSPISISLGNAVRKFMQTALSSGLKWTLGEGDPGHSDSSRHTHGTWAPNGKAGSGGAGLGGGGVVQSAWERIGEGIWNKWVQPAVDSLSNKLTSSGYGIAGNIGGALTTQAASKIKDYIIGASGGSGSGGISGGKSPSGLTIGEALSQGGWPDNLLVPASSTVWHESGGKADARNPSSTATGLMQILHSTAQGVGADPKKLTDPIYNTATGKKVYDQAGGFSPWVAAGRGGDYRMRPVTGYHLGGIIPGQSGEEVLVRAEAGERILSRQNNAALEGLTRSVEVWSKRAGSGAAAGGREIRDDATRRAIDRQTERLEKKLEEKGARIENVEEMVEALATAIPLVTESQAFKRRMDKQMGKSVRQLTGTLRGGG